VDLLEAEMALEIRADFTALGHDLSTRTWQHTLSILANALIA
jgi:hypothetical protein